MVIKGEMFLIDRLTYVSTRSLAGGSVGEVIEPGGCSMLGVFIAGGSSLLGVFIAGGVHWEMTVSLHFSSALLASCVRNVLSFLPAFAVMPSVSL